MRKLTITSVLLGLVLAFAAGCSDDDKVTGSVQTTPLGYTKGQIGATPMTSMNLEIYGNGAVTPNLDSMKIGDSLVNQLEWTMNADHWFVDSYWRIPFIEDGDTSTNQYDPGDTAVISVWGEGRFSSCRVKLLDPDLSRIMFVSPASLADTITSDDSDTLYWSKVEQADYYAITVGCRHYSSVWLFGYYYSTDNSFLLTADMIPESVTQCDIAITPFNGPDPRTDRTNWTGNLLDGVVFSPGAFSYTSIVISTPLLVPKGAALQNSPERPSWNPDEMVAKVYEQYLK